MEIFLVERNDLKGLQDDLQGFCWRSSHFCFLESVGQGIPGLLVGNAAFCKALPALKFFHRTLGFSAIDAIQTESLFRNNGAQHGLQVMDGCVFGTGGKTHSSS